MILRDIFIDLDRLQFPTEVAYPFKLRSRSLCHFLGRHIWKKQLRVPGFNRIVVTPSKDAVAKFEVNSCHVACITIPLAAERFEDLKGAELHEYYIGCLTRAVDEFLREFPDVLAAIHEGIGLFRAGGYTHEWIHQQKRFRELGLTAVLSCRMTPERFALRLIVLRAAKIVYDQEIFASDPDEVVFAHRFKEVIVTAGGLSVINRFKKPLLSLSLEQIETNQTPEPPPGSRFWRAGSGG